MKICVLGDSHSCVFRYCNLKNIKFHVLDVGGATAQGCVNPNSMTNALEIYKNHIINTKKYNSIIIMLGEVDCGYLVWVRSKRYNISVESQIDLCIQNINTFISSILLDKGYTSAQIILCGVHLPTIKDNTDIKFLTGARKEVDVNQYERTLKTLEYNKRLEAMAHKNGYKYIDITKTIIGDNGLVKAYYLNKDPSNHHLDNTKIVGLWANEVYNVLNTTDV